MRGDATASNTTTSGPHTSEQRRGQPYTVDHDTGGADRDVEEEQAEIGAFAAKFPLTYTTHTSSIAPDSSSPHHLCHLDWNAGLLDGRHPGLYRPRSIHATRLRPRMRLVEFGSYHVRVFGRIPAVLLRDAGGDVSRFPLLIPYFRLRCLFVLPFLCGGIVSCVMEWFL